MPLGQSTTPYQIYDAFFDVTKAATGWDIDTVKESLHVLSQTIDQTYPHLSAALDGVAKFSDTIGKRDEEVKHLLAQANQVASILGDRSEQVDRLLVNAKTLLAAFNERGQAINALLGNVAAFSEQVKGLINDNPNLNHVLEQLRTISDILVERKDDVAAGAGRGRQVPSVVERGHRVGTVLQGGPAQPGSRARSCSRSSTPRSRSAASTRRTSGAAPGCRNTGGPTPTAPGSPTARRRRRRRCWRAPRNIRDRPSRPDRRAPTRRRIPAATSPSGTRVCRGRGIRCPAPARASARSAAPGFPAPIDVATSPPNPNGLPPTPGIPIAGRPGDPAPDVPGTPVPLPPNAPPGARTEGLGPAGPTPPPSTFAPGLPPGPPAPAGPGNQLPAPFINPGGSGGSGVTGGSQN